MGCWAVDAVHIDRDHGLLWTVWLCRINTKIDVTKWGTLLLVALVAFIVLLIIGMFWVNKILWLVLSGVACLIFSAYLVSGRVWVRI
jgi:FtsH-binding integral membrane protein